jgi:arylformamidase
MPRLDPAWLDAEYNNRARVPEHVQILERWTKASALVREQSSRRLDVRYGDGPNETLDVFPTQRADAPVLVFIHGGYWRALDKSDVSFIAASFTNDGVMVVVPNYALAPAVSIETIALQLVESLTWTWRHAALYGGDPRRIVVAGHSAGGHLAAMMLSCAWQAVARDLPASLVRGALSISGLYDLEPVRQTPFLRDDLRLTPASARKLSPARFPAPDHGVLYATVGGNESDEFRRQNRLIRDAWGAKAVPVCEEIPGKNHFDVLHDLADPAGRLHRLALDLA